MPGWTVPVTRAAQFLQGDGAKGDAYLPLYPCPLLLTRVSWRRLRAGRAQPISGMALKYLSCHASPSSLAWLKPQDSSSLLTVKQHLLKLWPVKDRLCIP